MRHIALRLIIALLTFVAGVTLSSLLSFKKALTIESVPAPPTSVLVKVPSQDETLHRAISCGSHLIMHTFILGGVLNGKAVSKPEPAYPPDAKAARVQGTVAVSITVDEEGSVNSAEALSGPRLLQAAAVEAAQRARFSPTLIGGRPVMVKGTVTYNFVLK
jgi:TonB family protein